MMYGFLNSMLKQLDLQIPKMDKLQTDLKGVVSSSLFSFSLPLFLFKQVLKLNRMF